jgi:hypothetical protein
MTGRDQLRARESGPDRARNEEGHRTESGTCGKRVSGTIFEEMISELTDKKLLNTMPCSSRYCCKAEINFLSRNFFF